MLYVRVSLNVIDYFHVDIIFCFFFLCFYIIRGFLAYVVIWVLRFKFYDDKVFLYFKIIRKMTKLSDLIESHYNLLT